VDTFSLIIIIIYNDAVMLTFLTTKKKSIQEHYSLLRCVLIYGEKRAGQNTMTQVHRNEPSPLLKLGLQIFLFQNGFKI